MGKVSKVYTIQRRVYFNTKNIIWHQEIYQYKSVHQQMKGTKYDYSNRCQKSFDKIQQILLIKYKTKKNRRKLLQFDKDCLPKPNSKYMTFRSYFQKLGTRQDAHYHH